MFFKKIFAINQNKENLVYETSTYKMYYTTHNEIEISKFVYTGSINQYNILKKIHHDNLLNPIKISTKHKYILTTKLIPFETAYSEKTKEFNKYTALCLEKTLNFLHLQCKIQHNGINVESLFFTEEGKIILSGFDNSNTISDTNLIDNPDFIQFSNLIFKYLKINTCINTFCKQDFTESFFYKLEIFFFGFSVHTEDYKKMFVYQIRENKNEFIEIYKHRISNIFSEDLKGEFSFEYKKEIMDLIFFLDLQNIDPIINNLYCILNSEVRLYLFKSTKKYVDKIQNLDKSSDSLILGLKVKNKELRSETIKFLKNANTKYSGEKKNLILENMFSNIEDPSGCLEVLSFIRDTSPLFEKSDVVYRICKKYLDIKGCRNETLNIIQKFYPLFNKYKISTELLPQICTYLADESLQSPTFLLIEDILKDLKSHKEKIISRKWSIESFKDYFSTKTYVKSKDDDWDEEW